MQNFKLSTSNIKPCVENTFPEWNGAYKLSGYNSVTDASKTNDNEKAPVIKMSFEDKKRLLLFLKNFI